MVFFNQQTYPRGHKILYCIILFPPENIIHTTTIPRTRRQGTSVAPHSPGDSRCIGSWLSVAQDIGKNIGKGI